MTARQLTYGEAIREASAQALEADPDVFFIGQGVWSPWYVGNTMKDLEVDYGRQRVIDSPVSENATTGAAIGAALIGMKPVVIHPRMDFLVLAMDQMVNEAANWRYMFGGQVHVPIVIRSIINRGGEQGAQHAQALHAWLAHVPGLKVVMPSTAYDAKGLLLAAIEDPDPVVYIEDRWLYSETDPVPEDYYTVSIGEGVVRRTGSDVTVVGISFMAAEAMKAAAELEGRGVSVEVIDPRTVTPLDADLIFESVRKTGRLLVTDGGWTTGGVAGEIVSRVADEAFHHLKAPIKRVCLPDAPAPTSKVLEEAYFPKSPQIVQAIEKMLNRRN